LSVKIQIEARAIECAVENDPDESRLCHDRAAAAPANDVGVGNEIEGRVSGNFLFVEPTLRQIEWFFIVMLGARSTRALEIRERGNFLFRFLRNAPPFVKERRS